MSFIARRFIKYFGLHEERNSGSFGGQGVRNGLLAFSIVIKKRETNTEKFGLPLCIILQQELV